MKCPKCNEETSVTDSRNHQEGTETKRRRECLKCKHRFTTIEKEAGVEADKKKILFEIVTLLQKLK